MIVEIRPGQIQYKMNYRESLIYQQAYLKGKEDYKKVVRKRTDDLIKKYKNS